VAFAALGSFSCGFAALGDAREQLNVRFAVTGLLFLVFDLEVHFVLVWTFDATGVSQPTTLFSAVLRGHTLALGTLALGVPIQPNPNQ